MSAQRKVTTETIFPVSFYIRAASESGIEVVTVTRDGLQSIYRLNDLQLIHLASDATLQLAKINLARLAANKREVSNLGGKQPPSQ